MQSYSRAEYRRNDEDLDEYEDDGEGDEAEAWEEDYDKEDGDEEEEKEDRKPTKEELDYLKLRQQLKESLRKKMKKEHAAVSKGSLEKKRKLPYDNYGSFFGPSQPVIAQRVIQESKSLLENQHLASRISIPLANKKAPTSSSEGKKPAVHVEAPRVVNELKSKAQKLKDARDYSFLLSDDAELPAPPKGPPPRSVSVPSSDARSAQVSIKNNRPSMDKQGRGSVSNGREVKKLAPINRQRQPQPGDHKTVPSSRQNLPSSDPRRQFGSNTGSGPGRPVGYKASPSKVSAPTLQKKAPAVDTKNNVAVGRKPALLKANPMAQKKHLEQRREIQEPQKARIVKHLEQRREIQEPQKARIVKHLEQRREIREPQKARIVTKQAVPSRPQVKDPQQVPMRATKPEHKPKKHPVRRPFEEDEPDFRSVIRNMFRYNPNKYSGRDDDDSDMEANFDDILEEERKSARIARKEDERELRLIEEEERRERMRKRKRPSKE